MLHELLAKYRDEIVRRCEERYHARYPDRPREELLDTMPSFIDELIRAERMQAGLPDDTELPGPTEAARVHGEQRFKRGYKIEDITHDYGAICEVINDIASEEHVDLDPKAYKVMNMCLDEAMAQGITEYFALSRQSEDRDVAAWIGSLGHELRNALGSVVLAYGYVRNGVVGLDSRTARVLERSLNRLEVLVNQTLAAVQLRSGTEPRRERVTLCNLVHDIEDGALHERDIKIRVSVAEHLVVETDPSLLESALTNLMQNAIKYTRSGGQIDVRGREVDSKIVIEFEDECGGLSIEDHEHLFAPFVQGKHPRPGVGLGLAITRQAIETLGGTISLRNCPPKGCIFTVTLPRRES